MSGVVKYERFTTSGCKNIEIRKFRFVAKEIPVSIVKKAIISIVFNFYFLSLISRYTTGVSGTFSFLLQNKIL